MCMSIMPNEMHNVIPLKNDILFERGKSTLGNLTVSQEAHSGGAITGNQRQDIRIMYHK